MANPTTTPIRVEPSPWHVRTELAGTTLGDSRQAILHVAFGPPLFEGASMPLLPGYFFPSGDVAHEHLTEAGTDEVRRWWDVSVGDRRVARAAWTYVEPGATDRDLTGHVTFRWEAMDAWFEETEEVFFHARDPRKRIDVRRSTRHVEVRLDGRTLASSDRPALLAETDLPLRWYLPVEDVQMDLLEPSPTRTGCAYKGTARYWSLADGSTRDIAWSYPDPFPDGPLVKDLVCFFNEKVDIIVDGERQERPVTAWS